MTVLRVLSVVLALATISAFGMGCTDRYQDDELYILSQGNPETDADYAARTFLEVCLAMDALDDAFASDSGHYKALAERKQTLEEFLEIEVSCEGARESTQTIQAAVQSSPKLDEKGAYTGKEECGPAASSTFSDCSYYQVRSRAMRNVRTAWMEYIHRASFNTQSGLPEENRFDRVY